jgi:hypothetical protein
MNRTEVVFTPSTRGRPGIVEYSTLQSPSVGQSMEAVLYKSTPVAMVLVVY